jgi:uncharacterized protein YyaL (SSP411 family)
LPDVVRDGYRPFQVVALGTPGADETSVPLLQDRELVEGQGELARPAAYVCRNFTCQAPVTEPEALAALLRRK